MPQDPAAASVLVDHLFRSRAGQMVAWLTEQGVSEEEQRRVFNVGIGMCAVVPAADSGAGLVIGRVT